MADDKKKLSEEQQQSITETVAKAVAEALPMAVMAATQASMQARAQVLSQEQAKLGAEKAGRSRRCKDCGQKLIACKGKHMRMVVGPTNLRNWKSFPGFWINGVYYRSNKPGHLKTVPADNDLGNRIAVWENGEDNLRMGRQLSHYSGHITPRKPDAGRTANPLGFRGMGR